MMFLQVLLGVSLGAFLILNTNGVPVKGSKSQHQSSSNPLAGGNVVSHGRVGTGQATPVSYSGPAGFLKQDPSQPQFVPADPGFFGMNAMPEVVYSAGSVPVQAGNAGVYMPVSAGYYLPGYDAGSQQTGAAQSSQPEAKWVIAPQAFEEVSGNTQAQGSSALLPPPPGPPAPPALQSGESSNVVKEAELGNYQQQTEEFGYPDDRMGPGQGVPLVAMPNLGVGGYWGYTTYPFSYPYQALDYRLLYGLYPPGTYTTFSRNHEKGTDYYQDIHYLMEHDSDAPEIPQNPGSGQQKVFPDLS